MHLDDVAREAVAIAVSSKATIGGSGVSIVAWALSVNWLGWAGATIAVISLATNVYFQRRKDRRDAHESRIRLRMEAERLEMDKRESEERIRVMQREEQGPACQ